MSVDQRQRYLQMPMPPGWEVKYDFSSRKYFFIDHNTKGTSWEDPRPAYYMRLERQRAAQQPAPWPSRSPSAQAVSSLNARSASRSPAPSPARRPESIQLQQVRQQDHRSSSASEESIPALQGDEYELAVLQSKFPNHSKEECQRALSAAKRERPNRAGGQVTRAAQFLRGEGAQGDSSREKEEKERLLAAKCRSLSADFPDLPRETVMKTLRELDGNLYKCKERLRASQEAAGQERKRRALSERFPSVDQTLIADLLREAASRSDGDAFVERRLEFLAAESASSASPAAGHSQAPTESNARQRASLSPSNAAQRHPSPQPRSLAEGHDSLERQRAHRQLVDDLIREFPGVERALVRKTLASVQWSLQRGRDKLKAICNSAGRSASPASTITPAASPGRDLASTSRGPSPRPNTAGSSHSHQGRASPGPQTVVVRPKPKPKKKSPVEAPAPPQASPKSKPSPVQAAGTGFQHKTLARGPEPGLARGHDEQLCRGPDADLRHGRDPELAAGSAGNVGSDRSLHRGADASLLRRPNAHL